MKDLLKQSQKVKADADKILADSRILDLLSKYGKVELTGSYALDLMINGDIDIHLFVEKLDRNIATSLLSELMDKTEFLGYMFFDWVKYSDPRFPHGYYLGIKQKVEGYDKQWKIDIWLVEESRKEADEYMKLVEVNLTPEKKLAILKLKEYRNEKHPDLMSTVVYDAVFKAGVSTAEGFKEYLNENHL